MTKKDYELIALAISMVRDNEAQDKKCFNCLDTLSQYLSEKLEDDNPKFNPSKFLTACGVE